MVEYIERDVLLEKLNQEACDCEFMRLLSDIPAADVAPVVRCKDCKHWICFMNNPDGTLFGNCDACGNNFRDESDFCSYGERKDGEG